jgi:glycosyltransferase involved in cell wall biosynthesis
MKRSSELSKYEIKDKVLTVSIASYNAESCIENAIQSCLIDAIDVLDIIVVNDGSTDNTAIIARRYADLYPNSIRVIDKENGGYGSTINTSLNEARGRYFKLLDSDDLYDKNAFSGFVDILSSHNVDMAITPYYELRGADTTVVDQVASGFTGTMRFDYGLVPKVLGMHSIAYRTELLRDVGLCLPEHRLYTDGLFVTKPLMNVQQVFISHEPVYKYNLGLSGQSVSVESASRNWPDLRDLTTDLLDEYIAVPNGPAKSIIGYWLSGCAGLLLRILYGQKPTQTIRQEICNLLNMIKECPEAWQTCRTQNKSFKLLSHYPGLSYGLLHTAARIALRMQ